VLATLDQATTDLEPYVRRLRECVRTAIGTFQADFGPRLYKMALGTQASLIRDYIVDEIKREFDGEPGVSHKTSHGLFLLNIDNRYLLRFKKFDRRLRTRNIPTQLSLDFLLQQPLSLPGMPDAATHLNVGYKPGMTLATSTIWITRPDGGMLDWSWEITEPAQPIPFPAEDSPRRPRVRPRVVTDREATAGDDVRS
jgi:hypothetical protein